MRVVGSPNRLVTKPGAVQLVGAITFDGAAAVDTCMGYLAEHQVNRHERGSTSAHRSAAFAGGLRAGLLTTGQEGNRLWQSNWQIGDRDAPDRPIWAVSYHSQPVGFGPPGAAGVGPADRVTA